MSCCHLFNGVCDQQEARQLHNHLLRHLWEWSGTHKHNQYKCQTDEIRMRFDMCLVLSVLWEYWKIILFQKCAVHDVRITILYLRIDILSHAVFDNNCKLQAISNWIWALRWQSDRNRSGVDTTDIFFDVQLTNQQSEFTWRYALGRT